MQPPGSSCNPQALTLFLKHKAKETKVKIEPAISALEARISKGESTEKEKTQDRHPKEGAEAEVEVIEGIETLPLAETEAKAEAGAAL